MDNGSSESKETENSVEKLTPTPHVSESFLAQLLDVPAGEATSKERTPRKQNIKQEDIDHLFDRSSESC